MELKSCPFCGGEEIGVRKIYEDWGLGKDLIRVYVGCVSCGIGYEEEDEQEAINNWQRRYNK
jgi:Lar family restriction alleviation protein